MRILDSTTDRALRGITIYLTTTEARELRDSVENLLTDLTGHQHVPSEDYTKEITVCVYDPVGWNTLTSDRFGLSGSISSGDPLAPAMSEERIDALK